MDIGNTRWLVKSVIPDSVATVIATAKACIIMIGATVKDGNGNGIGNWKWKWKLEMIVKTWKWSSDNL